MINPYYALQHVQRAVTNRPLSLSQGQAAFNALDEVRPDLAKLILGGPIDPFYSDERLTVLFAWLRQRAIREDQDPDLRVEAAYNNLATVLYSTPTKVEEEDEPETCGSEFLIYGVAIGALSFLTALAFIGALLLS